VVAFNPGVVTHHRDAEVKADPKDVQRQLDNLQIPGLGDAPIIVLPPTGR
jgi:hypothetical protein